MAIKTALPIAFSCGHTETVDLAHVPAGRRKNHAFGLGKNRVCTKCFKTQGAADLDKLNRQTLLDATEFEQEHELPELTGTEKHLNWATRIRYQVLAAVLEEQDEETASEAFAAARALTRSGWWIDNCADKDLDTDDHLELITTADESDQPASIETENPF